MEYVEFLMLGCVCLYVILMFLCKIMNYIVIFFYNRELNVDEIIIN